MSNISINQASKLFKVSRNTIYARIKKGEITKNSDGNVSVQDMMRLFGNKADKKATEQAVTELLNTVNNTEQLICLLYTSPSPRDRTRSRMPSSA